MAKKTKRKRRVALAIILCVVLVGAAVALGTVWTMYRSYPYNFKETIEENAALYGQDPMLVAAVIRTESSWRTGAVSSVGAAGLMQIMPDTAKWIAELNGWDYKESVLKEPEYNIRLGCWYLDYLSKKFDGDVSKMLAAYNAGENAVKKWISQGLFEEGSTGIPYKETREFVKRVKDAYGKYNFLYKGR